MANLDQICDYMADYVSNGWEFGGSCTGGTDTVTIPDYSEVFIIVNGGGASFRTYSPLKITVSKVEVGGYYLSTTDFGLCNINVTNDGKTFQIRNCYYGRFDVKPNAVLYVYYKK